MKNILISGGSGLVGKHLTDQLLKMGYQVAWLSRNPAENAQIKTFKWDVNAGTIDPMAIEFADALVHLAGAGIADMAWSDKRKQEILDSRVKSTELLADQLKHQKKQLEIVVAASAVGYYGAVTSNHVFVESDPPANDFLGTTTQLWEGATNTFRELNIPTVQYRLGVVLTKDGGALSKMAAPVKFGLSAPLGNGKQIIPWIHVDDLCTMIVDALEQKIPDGVYNAVAPAITSNKEFMKTLSMVMKRPYFFPAVPAFIMRTLLGEMADMVLEGSAVSAQKLIETGFHHRYAELPKALANLIH
jgi:hypothetical protein